MIFQLKFNHLKKARDIARDSQINPIYSWRQINMHHSLRMTFFIAFTWIPFASLNG